VAVLEGHGATFISRGAVEADVAEGRMALSRVEGMEPAREIFLVRGAGRTPTRVAQAFVDFVKSRA
jgi:DNA-binding transcriptional LysR family regulator